MVCRLRCFECKCRACWSCWIASNIALTRLECSGLFGCRTRTLSSTGNHRIHHFSSLLDNIQVVTSRVTSLFSKEIWKATKTVAVIVFFFVCGRFNVFVRRVYVSKCFEWCFRLLENPRRVLGEAIDMSYRSKSLSILKFFSPFHFSSVELVWQLDVINMRQQAKRG